MTTPWPDPPGTPEPRTEAWEKPCCGGGLDRSDGCDCFAVLAEYEALMTSLMEPVYVRQVGGLWEVQR